MDQEGGGNCNTITRYHINAEGGICYGQVYFKISLIY